MGGPIAWGSWGHPDGPGFVPGIVIVRTCLHEGSLYSCRLRVSSRWRLAAAAHAKASSPAAIRGSRPLPPAEGNRLMEAYRYVLLASGVWTAPFSVQSMVTIAVPGMCVGVVAFQVPSGFLVRFETATLSNLTSVGMPRPGKAAFAGLASWALPVLRPSWPLAFDPQLYK